MDGLIGILSDLDWLTLAFAGLNAFALTLILQALFGTGTQADRQLHKRLDRIQARLTSADAAAAPRQVVSLKRNQAEEGGFGRFVPNRKALAQRLEQTGREFSVGKYLLISFAIGVITGAGLRLFLGTPGILAALIGLLNGLLVPHLYVSGLISRRRKAFLASFPEAIDLIVRGIRSGLPISESIALVGKEMPDPVGGEFRRVEQTIRLGRSMDDALLEVSRRIDTPEFKFFVITISVQRETGGNLAETLENLADILRRRRQVRLKVKALSAEARASAMIIGSLPFIMFAILMAVNADYVLQLIRDPRGVVMLSVGLVSQGIGIAVMTKMIRFEI